MSMGIMLGNLTLKQIEYRTGIELSAEDRAELNGMRQEKAENIASGKWHCFDLPFMIVCGDKPTAEKMVKILSAYDWSKAKQALQISWER
jgi:hypothetical protein